jgi:hypothetical protein
MAELIREFDRLVADTDGILYFARVYGDKRPSDGLWEGWLAFVASESKHLFETGRETEQSTREQLAYWASGLEHTYLEGALVRALERTRRERLPRRAG